MMSKVVIFVVISRKLSRDILPRVVRGNGSFPSQGSSCRMFVCA